MRTILFTLILTSTMASGHPLSISAFDEGGTIVFAEISNAINYRVEWSPSLEGGWTNFTGNYSQWLDNIPASGSGVITASVPMYYRVVATIPPEGMVYIPAGSFMMGNATNALTMAEGSTNELPQHSVNLDPYFIDKYEVSGQLWWHIVINSDGYSFSNYFVGDSARPKGDISWYDAVKWCNARSQVEGLTPVYFTDATLTNLYKTGSVDPYVDWSGNGYRLPTEAEWEKAARGGISDTRFPWADYTNKVSHAKANYEGNSAILFYDLSYGSSGFLTVPVGYYSPNNYGLHEMAGNVWEWCWDWYDGNYYSISPVANPNGPENGTLRVMRGGGSADFANYLRCSSREYQIPFGSYYDIGFRCVRPQ
jgi:formylglycine-generating enzyme